MSKRGCTERDTTVKRPARGFADSDVPLTPAMSPEPESRDATCACSQSALEPEDSCVPVTLAKSPEPESCDKNRALSPWAERDTCVDGVTSGLTHWWDVHQRTVDGKTYYQVEVDSVLDDKKMVFTVESKVLMSAFMKCVLKEMYGYEGPHHAVLWYGYLATCQNLDCELVEQREWTMSDFVSMAGPPKHRAIGLGLTSNLRKVKGVWRKMSKISEGFLCTWCERFVSEER